MGFFNRSHQYEVNETIKYSVTGQPCQLFPDNNCMPRRLSRAGLEINIVGKQIKEKAAKQRKVGISNASWRRKWTSTVPSVKIKEPSQEVQKQTTKANKFILYNVMLRI